MSSAKAVLAAAPPAPSPKKGAKTKNQAPALSRLIQKAVSASSDIDGLSLPALKKALKAGGYDVVKNNARLLTAIKRLVNKKVLVQSKGSFKLVKKPTAAGKKKVLAKKKKPKSKKVKSTKKAATGATPGAKQAPKKKKSKSPSKAKKPAAAKKPKKPKTLRKTKGKAAKSPKTRATKARK